MTLPNYLKLLLLLCSVVALAMGFWELNDGHYFGAAVWLFVARLCLPPKEDRP